VPNEIINQWEDWVSDDWAQWFAPPVFSAAELKAVAAYHAVWNHVVNNTPDPLPDLNRLASNPEWRKLEIAAEAGLTVFRQRGKLSEDREVV
jgi:hypothetical protein